MKSNLFLSMIIPSPTSGKKPKISPKAFIASTAVIIGDVTIEAGANIWFGAVLRGDEGHIHIGKNTSIQDNCVLHSEHEVECKVGNNIIVGHKATIHGPCIVEDYAMVGIDAVILQGTTVRKGALVAGGAVARGEIPAFALVAGVPAKVKKELDEKSRIEKGKEAALDYVTRAKKYLDQGLNHPGIEEFFDQTL